MIDLMKLAGKSNIQLGKDKNGKIFPFRQLIHMLTVVMVMVI